MKYLVYRFLRIDINRVLNKIKKYPMIVCIGTGETRGLRGGKRAEKLEF